MNFNQKYLDPLISKIRQYKSKCIIYNLKSLFIQQYQKKMYERLKKKKPQKLQHR